MTIHAFRQILFPVAVLALIAGGFAVGYLDVGRTLGPEGRLVVLDPVRLANAQRAFAVGLLDDEARLDTIVSLKQIGKRTEKVINEIAGPGAIVLVKQAVVGGEALPDITDEVLVALGLPVDAPTVDMKRFLTDTQPTDLSFIFQALTEEERKKKALEERRRYLEEQDRKRTERLLP